MAAAALFSTGGAAIKACTFDGPQVASLRSGIAAAALLLALPAARRGWSRSTLAIGAAYAATMILFVWSNKLTTAASSIFLQSTTPLFILVLGPWLLREPVRRADLGFTTAMMTALLLMFAGTEPAQQSAPNPALGNLLALMSGVTYAVTVVGFRWVARKDSEGAPGSSLASVVLAGNVMAFVACLIPGWPIPVPGLVDAAVLVYLGVFQIALAYVLLTRGLHGVTALEASLLLLVEPMLNPLWAWAVQGEVPGAWTLAAGAIILGATAWRTLRGAEPTPAPEPDRTWPVPSSGPSSAGGSPAPAALFETADPAPGADLPERRTR
ncbi:MAG: DMT family transporter [Candidatus Polarisedimenticolia bacterium]